MNGTDDDDDDDDDETTVGDDVLVVMSMIIRTTNWERNDALRTDWCTALSDLECDSEE